MTHFGFIGAGNMGEAILRGMVSGKVLPADCIHVFDPNAAKCALLKSELGVNIETSIAALANSCQMLLLAVKPNICAAVLGESASLLASHALISIVAGWSRDRLMQYLPETTRVLRVMPNTPALVGAGMTVFELGDTLTDEERELAMQLFGSVGRVSSAPANLISAVTGVSGSGPAYAYLFIEALADGGVRAGLPRTQAYELAAQTLLGSAKMVLDTQEHPGKLKDAVCSPGGTTIDAVASLEKHGFRNAVLEAVAACVAKSDAMSKA